MILLHILQSKLPKCYAALQIVDDNPEIHNPLNVNKLLFYNKRIRERFIYFSRGAKWWKLTG